MIGFDDDASCFVAERVYASPSDRVGLMFADVGLFLLVCLTCWARVVFVETADDASAELAASSAMSLGFAVIDDD